MSEGVSEGVWSDVRKAYETEDGTMLGSVEDCKQHDVELQVLGLRARGWRVEFGASGWTHPVHGYLAPMTLEATWEFVTGEEE